MELSRGFRVCMDPTRHAPWPAVHECSQHILLLTAWPKVHPWFQAPGERRGGRGPSLGVMGGRRGAVSGSDAALMELRGLVVKSAGRCPPRGECRPACGPCQGECEGELGRVGKVAAACHPPFLSCSLP